MSRLHRPVKLYIAGLALAALGLALTTLAQGGVPSREHAVLALALGGLVTIAWLFPLPCAFKTQLYLDTSVLVAAVLLLEPGFAILLAGAGTALAHAIRRESWPETIFNSAQTMLQAAAAGLILASGGWRVDDRPFSRPEQVPMIIVAGVAMAIVSDLAVATIVGLQSGIFSPRVWTQGLINTDRVEYLAQISQVGLGVMAAVLVEVNPWTLALLLLPAGAVYATLRHAVQLRGRAEAALRDSEVALAEAQRVAHLGSWDWSLATGEQLWSDEVYRIVGLAPQAFLPTYEIFLRCVPPADRRALDQAVHDALYEGRTFSLDHRVRRPDGVERIVHQQGEVVFDEVGRKVRLIGTVHDITERKQAEQARDELLTVVSHDLKNPLAVIRGQAQLLQLRLIRAGAVEPEEVVGRLASIDAAAAQMTAQIDELADVARLRIGQALELRLDTVDLVALARDRVAAHQRATDRHAIRTEPATTKLVGRWDQRRLERVLDNLLANAVKYSPAGGGITVRVGREENEAGTWAMLAVQDQGVGIPAADLPHVCERFRRGGNVRGVAGTGIGLAGVKQIVAQHGGTIAVDSREGRGSTFTVRLPLAS